MAYEMKPGTGSAFINDSGQGKAAFSGSFKLLDGTEYWISLYNNKTKAGKDYFGITVKQKGYRPATQDEVPAKDISKTVDDEIPF